MGVELKNESGFENDIGFDLLESIIDNENITEGIETSNDLFIPITFSREVPSKNKCLIHTDYSSCRGINTVHVQTIIEQLEERINLTLSNHKSFRDKEEVKSILGNNLNSPILIKKSSEFYEAKKHIKDLMVEGVSIFPYNLSQIEYELKIEFMRITEILPQDLQNVLESLKPYKPH